MNTRKINELPVLQQATAETNVLVEQNGTASRIPASALGGGGGSEKALIDKLAPAFKKTGVVVTCNPVEGHPLEVVSHLTDSSVNLLTGHSWDIENYSYPTIALDLPAGKYKLYSNSEGEVAVASNSEDNILGTVQGGEPREIVVTHTGGTLLVIDCNWSGYDVELYEVKDRNEFTSVTLTHNGKTITADFPETVTGGRFNWTTGELFVPQGNPNLIPVDLANMSNWGVDEQTGDKTYELPSLPNGTYTLAVDAKDKGLVLYVEVLDCGEWSSLDTVETGGFVTFELNGESYGYEEGCYIRLVDAGWISVDSEFTAIKLETGSEFTGYSTTYQLAPHEILGLAGVNNLKSNTGNTEVSGRADPTFVINDLYSKVNALMEG